MRLAVIRIAINMEREIRLTISISTVWWYVRHENCKELKHLNIYR